MLSRLTGGVILTALLAAGALAVQTPLAVDREQARGLTARAIQGDAVAERELVQLGPAALPAIRDLLAEVPVIRDRLTDAWVREVLEEALREEPDLRYHGQFKSLAVLGDDGGFALLRVFTDEDSPIPIRNRAAGALGDVGGKAHIPELRRVAEDFLTEAWVEREAGYVMARLGDRSLVDRWIETNLRITREPATTANVPAQIGAHTELAEIHYRTGDYASAVTDYRKKLVLLEELRDRVDPALRVPVDDEVTLLHYNLACSLCLSGRIDESFAALETSLAHADITLQMVQADGDLRALRATPRYVMWLERMKARAKAAEKPKPSIDRDPPKKT